jgi:glutamyl-tRNA synthetase
MHLGNAFAYLLAWLAARSEGGEVVLRMEDLDTLRCTEEYAEGIRQDLRWLGLEWDRESPPQRLRTGAYEEALETLRSKANVFPCWCTRGSLNLINAPHATDGHPIHPASCRLRSEEERRNMKGAPAWRLEAPDLTIRFEDGVYGPYSENLSTGCGDFVLRRADGVFVYQLAVVVDDGAAGVTQVVRGCDLLSSTPRQLYLCRLLGLPEPAYWHVPMLTDGEGRKLSKRDAAMDLTQLRKEYRAEEIIGRLAFRSGLIPREEAVSAKELLGEFRWDRLKKEDIVIS